LRVGEDLDPLSRPTVTPPRRVVCQAHASHRDARAWATVISLGLGTIRDRSGYGGSHPSLLLHQSHVLVGPVQVDSPQTSSQEPAVWHWRPHVRPGGQSAEHPSHVATSALPTSSQSVRQSQVPRHVGRKGSVTEDPLPLVGPRRTAFGSSARPDVPLASPSRSTRHEARGKHVTVQSKPAGQSTSQSAAQEMRQTPRTHSQSSGQPQLPARHHASPKLSDAASTADASRAARAASSVASEPCPPSAASLGAGPPSARAPSGCPAVNSES
jgi:hypothetical protein